MKLINHSKKVSNINRKLTAHAPNPIYGTTSVEHDSFVLDSLFPFLSIVVSERLDIVSFSCP